MNRNVLRIKLSAESLLDVYERGAMKHYVEELKVYINNKWKNMIDVFGIYEYDEENYVCFITDSERGMPYYSEVYKSESEACKELYEMALRLKHIHEKGLK